MPHRIPPTFLTKKSCIKIIFLWEKPNTRCISFSVLKDVIYVIYYPVLMSLAAYRRSQSIREIEFAKGGTQLQCIEVIAKHKYMMF